MNIAETSSVLLTRTSIQDLPPKTPAHARMLRASTMASATCGIDIPSAATVRGLERARGGRPEAAGWLEAGGRLALAPAGAAEPRR
jgi:hypothetical protein